MSLHSDYLTSKGGGKYGIRLMKPWTLHARLKLYKSMVAQSGPDNKYISFLFFFLPRHPGRQYPSAWAISAEERGWKYRLSIYYAKESDDGVFTCTTPKGHSNEVHVRVRNIQCPAIDSLDRNRVMAVEGNKMHSQARFACMEGFNLIGPEEITCTASGSWSETPPYCEVIQCPPLNLEDTHLRAEAHNRTYGSRVMFSCPTGYRLVGSPVIICLKNQTWSDAPPFCEGIRLRSEP
ncbi:UNVERIFIED_CONTAM: hig [Trichonephila clavipes]